MRELCGVVLGASIMFLFCSAHFHLRTARGKRGTAKQAREDAKKKQDEAKKADQGRTQAYFLGVVYLLLGLLILALTMLWLFDLFSFPSITAIPTPRP